MIGPLLAAALFLLRPAADVQIGVMLFHQVSDAPVKSAHGVDLIQRPWTSPAAFDRLLGELSDKGYHVIPLHLALNYLEGSVSAKDLPAKPLVFTFDDGYRSALTDATPILLKHHDVATMFFEGHATDNPRMPERLTTADLQTMRASGVWTLESHGWAGHSDLTIDAAGTTSPYWYANLQYLAAAHRYESLSEFENRLQLDLTLIRARFEPVVGAPMTAFAYPSGEYGRNVALAPGADPRTLIEAGHSNAAGLAPLIVEALSRAGYEAAFAVSLPDSAHLASRADSIWAIPRIGVGADFKESFLSNLEHLKGIEFPEVADGQFADPGPLCATGGNLFVASTNRPAIFALTATGRYVNHTDFPQLAIDRPSGHATISGLSCDGDTIIGVQQAGFDPNPRPYMVRFTIRKDATLDMRERVALPAAMNWLVGVASIGTQVYGVDDAGTIFNVKATQKLGAIDPSLNAQVRAHRFAGLAARNGVLYTIDTISHTVVAFAPSGIVIARTPIDPKARDLAFDGSHLLVTIWSSNRRAMRIYDILELPT